MMEMYLYFPDELWEKINEKTSKTGNSFNEECCNLLTYALDCIVEQEEKLNKKKNKAKKELEILAQLRGE